MTSCLNQSLRRISPLRSLCLILLANLVLLLINLMIIVVMFSLIAAAMVSPNAMNAQNVRCASIDFPGNVLVLCKMTRYPQSSWENYIP